MQSLRPGAHRNVGTQYHPRFAQHSPANHPSPGACDAAGMNPSALASNDKLRRPQRSDAAAFIRDHLRADAMQTLDNLSDRVARACFVHLASPSLHEPDRPSKPARYPRTNSASSDAVTAIRCLMSVSRCLISL